MAERVEKSWGYEVVLHNGDYCSKLLVYTKGTASSLHYHPKKHETFYVAEGAFDIEIDGVKRRMYPGDYAVIDPGTSHRVRSLNTYGLIVESSTHDDPEDCVRIVPSEN